MNLTQITQDAISDCNSITDIINKFELKYNGRLISKIKKYLIENNIDISHFYKTKYQTITINCPICNKEFTTKSRRKRTKNNLFLYLL